MKKIFLSPISPSLLPAKILSECIQPRKQARKSLMKAVSASDLPQSICRRLQDFFNLDFDQVILIQRKLKPFPAELWVKMNSSGVYFLPVQSNLRQADFDLWGNLHEPI